MKVFTLARQPHVSTLAGTGERGFADGDAQSALFDLPYGVTVDAQGNIIVADSENHRIRMVSLVIPTAAVLAVVSCRHKRLGKGCAPAMREMPDELWLKVFALARQQRVSTGLAGTGEEGFADGDAQSAQFNHPSGVAVDGQGNIIVADIRNHRIRMISMVE